MISVLTTIAGFVLPPAMKLIGRKMSQGKTEQDTASSIALEHPEVLPSYISAMSELWKAKAEFFNRDVVPGATPSLWVVNLRAAIRPMGVLAAIIILAATGLGFYSIDQQTATCLQFVISTWFGTRVTV